MKSIILFITIFSINILASQLNLSGGDVATIRANTDTTVTCGGPGSGGGYQNVPIVRCESNYSDSGCRGAYIGAPCDTGGKVCFSGIWGKKDSSGAIDCACK